MADNGFNSTVQALFKGLEGFLTTKTVVGDAVKFDDGTIILPLVDVTFGAGAGAFSGHWPDKGKTDGKNNAGGGMGGKDTAKCHSCHKRRRDKACKCQKSGWNDKNSRYDTGGHR